MRVIFVGVHNKPGFEPLDPRSKTGKLVDLCCDGIPSPVEIIKTNCFPGHEIPIKYDRAEILEAWRQRSTYDQLTDVVICLGRNVQQVFGESAIEFVPVVHPGRIFSATKKRNWILWTRMTVLSACLKKLQQPF